MVINDNGKHIDVKYRNEPEHMFQLNKKAHSSDRGPVELTIDESMNFDKPKTNVQSKPTDSEDREPGYHYF